jgi:hypothetical protein
MNLATKFNGEGLRVLDRPMNEAWMFIKKIKANTLPGFRSRIETNGKRDRSRI